MPRERINGNIIYGAATIAMEGETVQGDRYVMRRYPGGILIAVIDGLGHGPEAARAADIAVHVAETLPLHDLAELLERCHRELRGTRGVVMTAFSLSPTLGTVSSIGVGNVQGMLVREPGDDALPRKSFALLRGGVLGHALPSLRAAVEALREGDTLVLATDGVGIGFTTEERFDSPPQELAEDILARHALGTDDALVLVARYAGAGPSGG